MALGQLVAEGKMDWDTTSIKTYLPEFTLKDPVLTSQLTLADLLSHRTVSFPPSPSPSLLLGIRNSIFLPLLTANC